MKEEAENNDIIKVNVSLPSYKSHFSYIHICSQLQN